ncbi:hypothetical protein [Kaarinaea lacus]
MNTSLISTGCNLLPLSVRMLRLMISVLFVTAITLQTSLSEFWKLALAALAVYTFVTGVFGWDPLFAVLRLSIRQLPDHALGAVSQFECLAIGLFCIAAGIMNRNEDSLIFLLLPFLGIYPILLCAVKYDLLSFLLQTYRE